MKTKRILSILAAAALTLSVSAQQAVHDNYIGVNFGGGLNTMLYKTANGQQSVGAGFDAGIHYARFFNRTVGLGVGAQFSWANAYATYNWNEVTTGLTHPSNPYTPYNLTTGFNDFKERQNIGVLSIPVEVLFRKTLNDRAAFIGGVGLSLDIPLYGKYIAKGGSYSTTGVFPALGNYTIGNMPEHGFSTYTTTQDAKWNNRAKVGGSVIGDLGCRVALNDNWGMYFGIYLGYGFTNLIGEAKTDPLIMINAAEQIDYAGTFGSSETSKANLFRFGVKVAIDFGWPKVVKEAPVEEQLPVVDEEAERLAREKAERISRFNQYKSQQQTVCGSMAQPDDSPEAKALIAKAQQDIAALAYDDNLSEEESKARVDAIGEKLKKDLAAQREKDRLAREAAEKAAKWEAFKQRTEAINIYFDNASTDLAANDEDKAVIEELCAYMKEDSNIKVVLIGHTDNYGDPEQNLNYFGLKRAEALRDYLSAHGAPLDQMRCESRGQNEPIVPNDTRENRVRNRRVNIRFE